MCETPEQSSLPDENAEMEFTGWNSLQKLPKLESWLILEFLRWDQVSKTDHGDLGLKLVFFSSLTLLETTTLEIDSLTLYVCVVGEEGMGQ